LATVGAGRSASTSASLQCNAVDVINIWPSAWENEFLNKELILAFVLAKSLVKLPSKTSGFKRRIMGSRTRAVSQPICSSAKRTLLSGGVHMQWLAGAHVAVEVGTMMLSYSR